MANNGPEISFGGGQRTLMSIKILEAQGYTVEMMLLINKDWGVYGEDSIIINKWKSQNGLVKFFQPDFKNPYLPYLPAINWLKKEQAKYRKILFKDETIAFKAGFYLLDKHKIIVDLNDFLLPQISRFKKIKYLPLHWVLRKNIAQAWVLVENQKSYFGKKGYCVPNLPLNAFYEDDIFFKKQRSVYPTALFVGSYLGEFESFLNEADKYIKLIPSLNLFIVSRAITEDLKNKFTGNQYIWVNDAENVSEYYSKAWITIVPGYKKDGPLIKFIESIHFLTPVVCTEVSLNGYEIFNEEEDLIPNSNDVAAFVKNMEFLLSSESELDLRAKKLKSIADAKFSLNSIVKSLPFE